MWLKALPPLDTELRQGDLLAGLIVPLVSYPPKLVMVEGQTPAGGDLAVLETVCESFLVVSQCCSIASQKTVAVAPIRSTQRLSPEEIADQSEADPTARPEGANYMVNAHYLEPAPPTLPDLSPKAHVADLSRIVSMRRQRGSLEARRVAAMSPQGRRLLRMRLAAFFGRPETEDLEWFIEQGLPPGPAHPA